MNSNLRNRLLVAAVLATTAPLVLGSAQALAQDHGRQPSQTSSKDQDEKAKEERQKAAQARENAREHGSQAREHVREAAKADTHDERQQHLEAAQVERQRQAAAQQRASVREVAAKQASAKAERKDDHAGRQPAPAAARKPAPAAKQAARQPDRDQHPVARRLARADQDRLIAQQKSRVSSYRGWVNTQRHDSQRIAAAVRAQNRAQQYAYINDYNQRLFAQQQRYASMNFDYYNDPYFYSAPSYRYMRDGAYYTINQYGANMLQTAINDGYSEGYRAGRADRMDGWRSDYRSNWVYQNASYGYNGYYLDRGEYAYYFRQGFHRGYDDGYYSRYQYGTYRNGSYSILGTVVNTILGLQSYDRY